MKPGAGGEDGANVDEVTVVVVVVVVEFEDENENDDMLLSGTC